jgi:hypothetical protein
MDDRRTFEGKVAHVDNDPRNTYCLRDVNGCMASTDVDWIGRLVGQNVRITVEPLITIFLTERELSEYQKGTNEKGER